MSVVKIPPVGEPIICSENEVPKNVGELGVFILKTGRIRDDIYVRCYADRLSLHKDYYLYGNCERKTRRLSI